MAKKKIVIIEDEADIRELLEFHLEQAGYATVGCDDGAAAIDVVVQEEPDLIILDIMLPGMVGTEICKTLKQGDDTKRIPIIMLTAKGEEIDRVVGFELGADDYVTKPFSPRELVLRIKAILKRAQPAPGESQDVIRLNDISVNIPKHEVHCDGEPVSLTATEFSLLRTLIQRRGRVQSREMLLETVWGYDYAGFTRTVDTHMRRLRSKLGKSGDRIETVRGVGYRIKED